MGAAVPGFSCCLAGIRKQLHWFSWKKCWINHGCRIRLIMDRTEVTFCLSYGSNNLSVVFEHIILTETVFLVIKYLNPALRRPLILPVDPHKSSSDVSNILLNLHRTGFYCLLVVKLYTILLQYRLNSGSRIHDFKLKDEEESPSLNALLTTLP